MRSWFPSSSLARRCSIPSKSTCDESGQETCRAPISAQTCAGTNPASWTGQALAYDNEGRLTAWASAPSGSVDTASFLYDGSGQRVEQQSTPSSGSTTTTRYIDNCLEEDSNGTLTKYVTVAGLPSAVRVGTSGALSYLASDGLGSVSVALDGSGNVTAAQLYAPYGGLRYSSGAMPTAKGYTGQRADTLTGLDYYNARYYDPVAGQFTSADTVHGGLSPFAYVSGNPETNNDPSGHCPACIGFVIGFTVGFVADAAIQYASNGGNLQNIDWGQAAGYGVEGAVAGALIGLVGPLGLGYVSTEGFVSAGVTGALEGAGQVVVSGDTNGADIARGGLGGGLASIIGAGAGAYAGRVGGSILNNQGEWRWADAVINGAVGNGAANYAGQLASGQPLDGQAVLGAMIAGAGGNVVGFYVPGTGTIAVSGADWAMWALLSMRQDNPAPVLPSPSYGRSSPWAPWSYSHYGHGRVG